MGELRFCLWKLDVLLGSCRQRGIEVFCSGSDLSFSALEFSLKLICVHSDFVARIETEGGGSVAARQGR